MKKGCSFYARKILNTEQEVLFLMLWRARCWSRTKRDSVSSVGVKEMPFSHLQSHKHRRNPGGDASHLALSVTHRMTTTLKPRTRFFLPPFKATSIPFSCSWFKQKCGNLHIFLQHEQIYLVSHLQFELYLLSSESRCNIKLVGHLLTLSLPFFVEWNKRKSKARFSKTRDKSRCDIWFEEYRFLWIYSLCKPNCLPWNGKSLN